MANESNYAIEMYGDYGNDDVQLISGFIEGGINDIPVALIECVSNDRLLSLDDFVGSHMGFSISGSDGKVQNFYGSCISMEYRGSESGEGHYFAEIRPWLWFLTRSRNNRIFQSKSATDIVRKVLGDYGFSNDLKFNTSNKDAVREYCVQYRETDFDFIKRLLEEEGIYFYFEFADSECKLVLADNPSTHSPMPIDDVLPFRDDEAETQLDHLYKWEAKEKVVSGKVSLEDYDFERPSASLEVTSENASGSHPHKDYEVYKYPGRYHDASIGTDFVRTQMEALAAEYQTWSGEGNILNLWVGHIFNIIDHPRHTSAADSTFVATRVKQFFRLDSEGARKTASLLEGLHNFGLSEFEHTRITFDAVLKSKPLHMVATVRKPEITGVQTAVVTGPAGDEIYTDKYGRIKVQFHWDRDGQKDEKSSCWLRTMMPMAGKNWGAIAVPRIGQEVVVQFEEGDPDRPLCVGVLYNADLMPPYDLPANATRSGVKTNSSKGGAGYNELMFEDKKGNELVRLEAEKDFVQTVQNSAHIKVGYKHAKDTKAAEASGDGSMKVQVQNNLDEIIADGDHFFEVSSGNQTIKIEEDKDETIRGKSTQIITKDVTETVKSGNVTRKLNSGNETTTLSKGNYSVAASGGKIELTAAQSITLKVGGSSIVVDTKGVTIKGPMITVQGNAKVDVKSPMTTVKGDAMLTLKGGLTMIN
jgi:type VI secretion system secreted protein VgrG